MCVHYFSIYLLKYLSPCYFKEYLLTAEFSFSRVFCSRKNGSLVNFCSLSHNVLSEKECILKSHFQRFLFSACILLVDFVNNFSIKL